LAFVAFSSDGKLSAQRHSKKSMDRNRVLALNMAIADWLKRRSLPVFRQGTRQN